MFLLCTNLNFDNYFTFIELLVKLKEHKIWAVGTLRTDRMRTCKLKSEEELKKEGRGSFVDSIDLNSGCCIVCWFDNKSIQLASNHVFIDPVDSVHRWSKSERKLISVLRPHIVKKIYCLYGQYVTYFVTVDFMSLYRMDHTSKRWYIRIFYWILASSVTNAWLSYRNDYVILNNNGQRQKSDPNIVYYGSIISFNEKCKTYT